MEPVRTGLRQLMSDLLRARPAEEAVLLAWPLVCGREVAARSQAVSFSDGNLVVEVADATWRNQLQSFAPRYISGYAELLGPLVKSVEFKKQQSSVGDQRSAKQHSALSNQQSAKPVQQEQSALSAQRSAKPVGSASTSATQRSKKKI